MNTIPHQLDWVAKRAACTVAQVFNELRTGIENDISAINIAKHLSLEDSFAVELMENVTGVLVGRPLMVPNRRIAFVVYGIGIEVRSEIASQSKFSASITLNDEGRCVLRLEDGTELEQWQFRKRALESLFFGD